MESGKGSVLRMVKDGEGKVIFGSKGDSYIFFEFDPLPYLSLSPQTDPLTPLSTRLSSSYTTPPFPLL